MLMYPIIKSLHLITVISWIASLFSLAVLFPFHLKSTEAVVKEKLAQIEFFLLKRLANPLMMATLALGVFTLVLNPVLLKAPWMHAKLLAVVLFCGYHGSLSKTRRQLSEGVEVSAGKVKVLSFLPFVLTSIIVFLVIVKPF